MAMWLLTDSSLTKEMTISVVHWVQNTTRWPTPTRRRKIELAGVCAQKIECLAFLFGQQKIEEYIRKLWARAI